MLLYTASVITLRQKAQVCDVRHKTASVITLRQGAQVCDVRYNPSDELHRLSGAARGSNGEQVNSDEHELRWGNTGRA